MFVNSLIKFMGQEYAFVFTVATFTIAAIGLLITIFAIKKPEYNKLKIILICITSLIIVICIFSAICYIVYNKPKESGVESGSSGLTSDVISSSEDGGSSSSTQTITTTHTPPDSNPETFALHAQQDLGTNKWGYVDGNNTVVIPYIYDWADDFIDGYAAVRLNYDWGFIDTYGNEVIPFEYHGAWSFINGFAPVFNGELWGFIDESGVIKIPFKFKNISRTFRGNELVYLDENDDIIKYDEINNNVIDSASPVPVIDIFSSSVSAYMVDSNLTIAVDKDCLVFIRDNSDFPYTWGVGLSSSFKEVVGNYIIDIKISIDENYSVKEIKMDVLKQLQEGVLVIDKMNNTCQAHFDGQQFIISCDIINDYIPLEELCVQSVFLYNDYE